MKRIMTNPTRARAARAGVSALLALLFAGSAAAALASALSVELAAPALYVPALFAALLCAVGTLSTPGAIAASAGFIALCAGYIASHAAGFAALRPLFDAWSGHAADAAQAALGAGTLLTGGAFVMGALFFALLDHRDFTSVAIMLLLAIFVSCHAMSKSASLAACAPGMVGAAVAFALTGGIQRGPSALRVLLPTLLALALAFALLPPQGRTWPPMERAAERVRSMFEQYFRFTQERVAFSISQEGYDHAGRVGDSVVSMLGGPADPSDEPVMRVETDVELLLRGAIRGTYTGWSWVDTEPKNRYLFYDITHRAVRDRIFRPGRELDGALMEADVSVEMLGEGTSTLFVTGMLERFNMDLSTAVYYNTAGEVFLTRDVQAGDRYSLRALLPEQGEALRQAVVRGQEVGDAEYAQIQASYTALPSGIDGGVYALTQRVVQDAGNDYDRALAIQNYLRANMRYTLQPEMPPPGRDFVSHFLMDTQAGYCSYYATAMAVMGRIAGLPARYVEGYLARPDRGALTGEDAHAWAEVYFRGVGWVPFDATGGASGSGAGGNPNDGAELPSVGDGEGLTEGEGDYRGDSDGAGLPPEDEGGAPTPSPDPDDGGASTPSPEPDAGDAPDDAPEPDAGDAPDDVPDDAPEPDATPEKNEGRRGAWAWLSALLLVALLALAARWAVKRLRASDPVALCRARKDAGESAMMLYRANLTLLSCLGQFPAGGETPEAFANRVAQPLNNPDYVAFVRAVTDARYARRPLTRADVETGLRAYRRFLEALGPMDRARFAAARITRGLGDCETIP